ncbi:hypothetical protein Cfor_09794 [Coptotermes formosanus]|uniref:DDE Tnp4 domain-containing protein n=1 Tax=Coptotermes formosanus TaxID=36987 RepID=A0A6L2Q668_COPFO|nr:hypothetical protein Cfor_09794 [Coptotermes formosanus]
MDGKHVQILAPRNSGSSFFNYKGNFSVVFFAVVDANYKVIYADMRCQGCISDGWMFAYTALCTKLEEKQLCVPISRPLPGRINAVEFVNANARIAYSPPGAFDAEEAENGTFTPGPWRQEIGKEECFLNLQNIPRGPNNFAQDIRKAFMEYFISHEGSVPWQDEYA